MEVYQYHSCGHVNDKKANLQFSNIRTALIEMVCSDAVRHDVNELYINCIYCRWLLSASCSVLANIVHKTCSPSHLRWMLQKRDEFCWRFPHGCAAEWCQQLTMLDRNNNLTFLIVSHVPITNRISAIRGLWWSSSLRTSALPFYMLSLSIWHTLCQQQLIMCSPTPSKKS